jgi:hypothetical protein
MATRWSLTIDCARPGELARFWALALGYVEKPAPAGFGSWEEWFAHHEVPEEEWGDGAYLSDPDGVGPALSFLRVPEPKTAKNRMHPDIQAGGGRETDWDVRWPRVRATVGRLTAAGARVVRVHELAGRPDHVEMADPEGNEFCVL